MGDPRADRRIPEGSAPGAALTLHRAAEATEASADRPREASAVAARRAGEVGGLRAQDFDAKRCRLTVAQAVVRTRSGRAIGPPKTDESRRTITIPCSLAKELAAFAKANGTRTGGLIFQTVGGGLIDHVILTKMTQRAAEKAGLGPVSFHQLRDACVSLLIDAGANPRAIQVYLGHSDLRTTLQTYGHLFAGSDESLADSMESRRAEFLEKLKRL